MYSAVDLQHPVYSEGHNICLMAKERKLKNLKVVDLKNICTNLSLTTTGNQQRKVTFINAIEEFILVHVAICSKTSTVSGSINLKQSYERSLDDSVRDQISGDAIFYDCYYAILTLYIVVKNVY